MNRRFLTGVFAVGSMAVMGIQAEVAQAANLTSNPFLGGLGLVVNQSPACTAGSVTGFADCVGSFNLQSGQNDVTNGASNNLASQVLATGVFGGIKNWTFNEKINANGSTTGTDPLGFNWANVGENQTSGQFNFSTFNSATTALVISLKSARDFSIYYIPVNALTGSTVNWNMLGVALNKNMKPQALSHASVYFNTVAPPTPVPTPALLPGLIGIGLAAMRKKKQSAAQDA